MLYLKALFLGLLQGITEFLPISSSGHLSIFQNLFGMNLEGMDGGIFDIFLHFGTLVSIVIMYKKTILSILHDTLSCFRKDERGEAGQKKGRLPHNVRLLLLIIVATVPLLFVFPFKGWLDGLTSNTAFIGLALIVTGGLIYFSNKIADGKKTETSTTVGDAFLIGLGQALAVMPGLSRSGTTICVGLSRGVKRDFIVKFSFLMSIPAVLGAFLVSIIDVIKEGIQWSLLPPAILGMIVAAVSGCVAISLVKILINKKRFGKFAYYCWGAGILTIILTYVL